MGEGGGEKEGSVDVTYVVGVGHRFGQKYVNGKNFANPQFSQLRKRNAIHIANFTTTVDPE